MERKKVMLIMWRAGEAHLSVCNSLKAAACKRAKSWDVSIVHFLKDICPGLDPLESYLKFSNEDLYNFLLHHDLFPLVSLQLKVGGKIIRKKWIAGVGEVKKYMIQHKPDYVISAVHHFNGILATALRELSIPFGIVPTEVMDLEESPLWFAPSACSSADFFSLATGNMVLQGRRLGCGDNAVFSGGLVINPVFYEANFKKKTPLEARSFLKLEKTLFTVMIAMGGAGGLGIFKIIRELEKGYGERIQIIACCGRDNKLKARLDRWAPQSKHLIVPLGFTENFPLLLKASDLLITKPGPTTIWEALVAETPLVLDAGKVIIWEQAQVDFVERHHLGVVMKKRSTLPPLLTGLRRKNGKILKEMKIKMVEFPKKDAIDEIFKRIEARLYD